MNMTNTNNTVNETTPALKTWLEGAQKIVSDYMSANFPTQGKRLELQFGKRYVRVVSSNKHTDDEGKVTWNGQSAWAFVDLTNGDVLKTAGWTSPAKHARGNIFDDKNGLGMITAYGPQYLR